MSFPAPPIKILDEIHRLSIDLDTLGKELDRATRNFAAKEAQYDIAEAKSLIHSDQSSSDKRKAEALVDNIQLYGKMKAAWGEMEGLKRRSNNISGALSGFQTELNTLTKELGTPGKFDA